LAIEYGLVLQTTDRDFARFSGLSWENPLADWALTG
jgi:predicted nucleic acid-binding protein